MSNELAISKPADLTKFLNTAIGSIKAALPKHLNPDRMVRLATTCWSTTPALRNCTPVSILGSIITASQLGLEPGIAGQGYLIPYKQTCQFIPGWQGLVGLLNNTGRATAWTGSVFEGDVFEVELGSTQRIIHKPGPNCGDESKLTWVYACGKVNGSEVPVIEAWPISRVLKHRDKYNKVGQKHYSYGNFEMYARKVVLLQVLKYMPRSVELNNAMAVAENSEIGRMSKVDETGIVIDLDDDGKEPSAPQPLNLGSTKEASAGMNQPKALRGLLAQAKLTEAKLLAFLRECGELDESIGSLEEADDIKPSVLKRALEMWSEVESKIKEGK